MRNCLILGCGRSGTSMLAGTLRAAGYFQGNETLPADSSNPKGYFEDRTINAINDELIAAHLQRDWSYRARSRLFGEKIPTGVHWLACPRTPVTNAASPDVRQMIGKAVSRTPFAHKDPRFCHTLDVWKPFLPADTRFLVIFRDPVSTAASILKRKQERPYADSFRLSFNDAGNVWHRAYSHVTQQMDDRENYLFVHFDDVLNGVARPHIETFLETEIDASFPEAGLSRTENSQSATMPTRWTRLYNELLQLAEKPSSTAGPHSQTKRTRTALPRRVPRNGADQEEKLQKGRFVQTIAATDQTKLCIVQPTEATISETFIRAHAERLPARTTVVHGHIPHIGNGPLLSQSLAKRAMRRAYAVASRKDANWEQAVAYEKALRKTRPDVVLAEYGPTGVDVMDICRRQQIPLVVHFHGYDASQHDVLERNRSAYQTMFRQAAAIVAVSKRMQQELLALGADANKLHYNPYGVDCDAFTQAEPGKRPPVFVAVGRFVEKKAPQLTLLAFGRVLHDCPSAQLRMVGDGPLLGACQALARGLNIEQQVSFLGAQGHDRVRQEMQQARCFVQHSLRASNGDSEGTPVAILEAGASGLPVVATRHAGIPDVVQHGHTGLLVDEHDVNAMVEAMLHLAEKPVVAAEMGKAARLRIVECFPMQRSINRLASIIESCVENQAQRSIAQ